MSELDVTIVTLPAMRVAASLGYSETPENDAFTKILAWARPLGLLADMETHRWFGFNNPNPSPGSPKYGYEVWVSIGEDLKPTGDIKVKSFAGGLYAVARCVGIPNIGQVWGDLVEWRERSPYHKAHHQWLEEHIGGFDLPEEEIVLDCLLPIEE